MSKTDELSDGAWFIHQICHLDISPAAKQRVLELVKGLAGQRIYFAKAKLVRPDRESDDRRLCLECSNLNGYSASSWRCGNWQRAGVEIKARDAGLLGDLVRTLQRCHLRQAIYCTKTVRKTTGDPGEIQGHAGRRTRDIPLAPETTHVFRFVLSTHWGPLHWRTGFRNTV